MFEKYSNSFLKDFDFDFLLEKFEKKRFLNFSRGEFLYHEKEPVKNIYLVLSGGLFLIKKGSDSINGIMNKLGTGDILGLEDALTGKYYTNSAYVSRESNILEICKDDFLQITGRNDEFNLWVLKYLSNRSSDFLG